MPEWIKGTQEICEQWLKKAWYDRGHYHAWPEYSDKDSRLGWAREMAAEIATSVNAKLCPYCAAGDKPTDGKHKVESLSECEPNEATDGRSTVVDWVKCGAIL